MSAPIPDLWGVWDNLEAIRANARRPLFAAWWEQHLRKLVSDCAQPVAPVTSADTACAAAKAAQEAAFASVVAADEDLGRHALATLAGVRDGTGDWQNPQARDMYPQDRADLITAETTKGCAAALSWLAPLLDDARRDEFVAMIATRGGVPIYESAAAGCWWGSALNSNWTAVLNSGLGVAALVLAPSDPATAQTWRSFACARIREMLDLAAEEGAGIEGAGYWLYCFGSIQDFVEALHNAGGEDLYTHPFWHCCSRFLPYLALPDLSAWVNFGDTGYRGLGGSSFFHGVAARARDPLAQWFAGRILDGHGGAGWKNLVYYDPTVPEQPLDPEPPCRVFSSIHLASFRSGWEPDAVFLLLRGGSNAWSHMHLDLNSFFITAYGERLATEPGPAPYSVHYWHSIEPAVSTAWHNCIVVDGGHQRVPAQFAVSYDLEAAGDCYSRLSDHLSCDAIEMVRGDATTAYGDSLARAWRDVVYLKPDVFVVHDDLLAHPVRTQRNFEWMLHSECPLVDVADGIEARGERARLLIQPVFPRGWEHKPVAGRTIPHGSEGGMPLHAISLRPPWHHKWNVDPRRSPYPHWDPRGDAQPLYGRECRYLVVLSALKGDAAARYTVAPMEAGAARGVRLVAPGETIAVVFNPTGGVVEMGGLCTDAEKAVARHAGARLTWALVRGTTLSWRGHRLFAGQAATSRTGDTEVEDMP